MQEKYPWGLKYKDFDEQSNIRKNYVLKTIRYFDIFLTKHLYFSIYHQEIEISKFFAPSN